MCISLCGDGVRDNGDAELQEEERLEKFWLCSGDKVGSGDVNGDNRRCSDAIRKVWKVDDATAIR